MMAIKVNSEKFQNESVFSSKMFAMYIIMVGLVSCVRALPVNNTCTEIANILKLA